MTTSTITPSTLDLRDELNRVASSVDAVANLLLGAIEDGKEPSREEVSDAITLLDLVARQARAAA
ncbi:hypothetical protein [Geothrix sp.]|jgi:hypothetical protein|uniref:hypothetical protein n=1 Tax=Geothrix sp. TaxID=1962974 RepID=UPI0025BF46E9|nr:hypothetical protein [Geothrix sp.]